MVKLNGEIKEFSESETITYQLLKGLIKAEGLNLKSAVDRFNDCYPDLKTTPQNLSNKLSRDSMKLSEFLKFIKALGYTLSFEKEIEPGTQIISTPKNKIEQHFNTTFDEKMVEGISSYVSENMKTVIVAGQNADAAVSWIQTFCNEHKDEIQTLLDEMMLLTTIQEKFDVQCKPTFKKPIKE